MCEALGLTDAVYPGLSWNLWVNRFFEDLKEFRGIGQRFDRVFFSGAVSVYACLVGQYRFFCDGAEFFLSDHFGLLGFLDVHKAYGVCLGASGTAVVRDRRAALARVRDREHLSEVQHCKERERVGREEAAFRRVQAGDRDREELLKRSRKEARKVQESRKAEVTRVFFGKESLFGENCAACFVADSPLAPGAVRLPSLEGLPGVEACAAWKSCVSGGFPRFAGLKNSGNMCYVNAAAQVLLRVPAFAVFLDSHSSLCGAGLFCVTCALHQTRRQLGSMKEPALVAIRGAVDGSFADAGQHDVADFVQRLLAQMI